MTQRWKDLRDRAVETSDLSLDRRRVPADQDRRQLGLGLPHRQELRRVLLVHDPVLWRPDLRRVDGTPLLFLAVLTTEDNRFYLQPSINQKPGQGSCHFDVSIFAPVKSELESRPSRSQMPSASANDTSRRRTFSGVTNAIEPDHASGAPGR